jgi:hypothetical protein
VWQLHNKSDAVGVEVVVYLIVVPKEARTLKEQIEKRLEDLQRQGEREIERVIGEIERQIVDWLAEEARRRVPCLNGIVAIVGLLIVGVVGVVVPRTRRSRHRE